MLDEQGNFVAVEGVRRVSKVQIGGVDIDPDKMYTLASHNYMLKLGGGGYTMFADNSFVKDEVMTDNQVLVSYIQDKLHGIIPESRYGDPYGAGRIVLKAAQEEQEATQP